MPETGFLDRLVSVAGKQFRYQVYLPAAFTPRRAWPVILFLHGVGERGEDGLRPTEVGIGSAIRRNARRFPVLVVFPQARTEYHGWRGDAAAAALRALDRTVAEFRGDPRRLYLTGLSMGGSGTLRLAAENPGRFAALAPVSPDFGDELGSPRPHAGDPSDPYLALARALGKTPVWIFQGEEDTAPPPAVTRRLVRTLERFSAEVRYTEYPRVGHNAWDPAYAAPELIPWLLAQRRDLAPIATME
jgi:predicted peptidase